MADNILDLQTDEVTPVLQAEEAQATDVKQDPDTETTKRIASLAVVGTALVQRANDNTGQTNFMLAHDALQDFEAGINRLHLDPASEKGMRDLIEYLRGKIKKRLDSNINMTALK